MGTFCHSTDLENIFYHIQTFIRIHKHKHALRHTILLSMRQWNKQYILFSRLFLFLFSYLLLAIRSCVCAPLVRVLTLSLFNMLCLHSISSIAYHFDWWTFRTIAVDSVVVVVFENHRWRYSLNIWWSWCKTNGSLSFFVVYSVDQPGCVCLWSDKINSFLFKNTFFGAEKFNVFNVCKCLSTTSEADFISEINLNEYFNYLWSWLYSRDHFEWVERRFLRKLSIFRRYLHVASAWLKHWM